MKKAICIFIVLISSFSYSQTKQNDATWEETIQFLKEHLNVFNFTQTYNGGKMYGRFTANINESDILTYKQVFKDGSYQTFTVNLNYLKEFKVMTGTSTMWLIFQNSMIERISSDDGTQRVTNIYLSLLQRRKSKYNNEVFVLKPNNELFKRIKKAWIHLAYLANEKRKKSKF